MDEIPARVSGKEERDRPGGVQSIARAFALLEDIARHREGASLAELARRSGLHTSTAFHLLQTLVRLGYVRQEAETRRYRVGRPLFALAAACRDEIELLHLATPVLEALSAETGEAAHFGIWQGSAVLVLARTQGSGAFQLAERPGLLRPAHATALGKALLAGLAPEALARFLATAPFPALTPHTLTTAEALDAALAAVRARGYATDEGEFHPEVVCLAAPVRDFTGAVVGALGLSRPAWRGGGEALHPLAPAVMARAQALSALLGAPEADEARTGGRKEPGVPAQPTP